jgi:hypothetical protein
MGLTGQRFDCMVFHMTLANELDLKQRLAKLSERDRLAISGYLLSLKHQSKRGRAENSKLMKEMDQGGKIPLSQIARELGHD